MIFSTSSNLCGLPLPLKVPKQQPAESWEDVPVKQPLSTFSVSYILSQNWVCCWSLSDAGYWAKLSLLPQRLCHFLTNKYFHDTKCIF